MQDNFRIGDKVYFEYDGSIKYRRIIKIVQIEEGTVAVFDEGCVREAMKKSLDKIFHTIEDLWKELDKNE